MDWNIRTSLVVVEDWRLGGSGWMGRDVPARPTDQLYRPSGNVTCTLHMFNVNMLELYVVPSRTDRGQFITSFRHTNTDADFQSWRSPIEVTAGHKCPQH